MIIGSILGAMFTFSCKERAVSPEDSVPDRCAKIVSLAPSITEILFALELGNKVAGVTNFCTYPKEAQGIPKIGGYYDPSAEAVIALRPSIVMALREQSEIVAKMRSAGLDVLTVPGKALDDIHTAVELIAQACNAEQQERSLGLKLKAELAPEQMSGERPKVLVVVGRDMAGDKIRDVFAAGDDKFYDRLIDLAGGRNAYNNAEAAYPKLSIEGLLQLNPDIIIDIVQPPKPGEKPAGADDWKQLARLRAVKEKQVFVLTADWAAIPGPRIGAFKKRLFDIVFAYRQKERDAADY